jgi:curved DNA-binding protein
MAEPRRDLYAILGVTRNASTEEVRRAFRERARVAHPDRLPEDPGAAERFKRINLAFEVLTDVSRRRLYDEFGEAGLRPGFDPEAQRTYRRWQPPGVRAGAGWSGNLGDLFPPARRAASADTPSFGEQDVQAFFAAAMARRRGRRNADRTTEPPSASGAPGERAGVVVLSLRESLRGAERTLPAGGGGALRVRIPPGVQDGERLRVGAGGSGTGPFWVTVRVDPHPRVRRDGDDLLVDLPITLGEAWRGLSLEVPAGDSAVPVEVPPGALSGDRVVVAGAGAPRRGGGRGRLIARIEVRRPPPSAEADALFDALDRLYPAEPREPFDW